MLKRHSCSTPFKPPFKKDRTEVQTEVKEQNSSSVKKEDVVVLRSKEQELVIQIEALKEQGYSTEKLAEFIGKLHEYNEIKDIGQAILGQIASYENVPVKSLYEKYGLSLDD